MSGVIIGVLLGVGVFLAYVWLLKQPDPDCPHDPLDCGSRQ